ncbi:hypothetical protein D3C76_966670 [compost metagenome]
MKLIENWRQAWRFYSVQLAMLIAVLGLLQIEVLPLLREQMSPAVYAWLNVALALVLGIVRLVQQPSAMPPQEREP